MIKELCTENISDLPYLESGEISRVELCHYLAIGGITPSYGAIKAAKNCLHKKGIELAVIIRPRGGNFTYNDFELQIMKEDIVQAVHLGCDALVFGMLTKDNLLDCQAIEHLLPATQGVQLVFHMAFDWIPKEEQKAALDKLIHYGFTRILLHGAIERQDFVKNVKQIKELVEYADNRIEIMIGGGVTAENAQELSRLTGTPYVHGTAIIRKARN